MDNDTRRGLYLRDRSELTAAQRRRLVKREHAALAAVPRNVTRRARLDVLRMERVRRASIRALFTRRAA